MAGGDGGGDGSGGVVVESQYTGCVHQPSWQFDSVVPM